MMKNLQEKATVNNGSNPFEATMDYDTEIVCGEFATKERPEYTSSYEKKLLICSFPFSSGVRAPTLPLGQSRIRRSGQRRWQKDNHR